MWRHTHQVMNSLCINSCMNESIDINNFRILFFFSFLLSIKYRVYNQIQSSWCFSSIYLFFHYYYLWLTSKMQRYGDKRIYIYDFYSHNNGGWLKSFPMDDGAIYIYIYIYLYIYIHFIFNVMGTDDLVTQGARASVIMILIYLHQTAFAC